MGGALVSKLDLGVVWEALPALLQGCAATLFLAACGMMLATVIGVAGVVLRSSRLKAVRLPTIWFVEIIRNTPFLVQIFFIFFALPYLGVRLNPTATAIVALGLNGGAYAIEIIRGGVESISKGQSEAGLALGLNRSQVFRLIILRPALRAIFPSLTGQFIMLTLTSSIASSVGAYELTNVAQRIEADTFRSFEVFFTITGMYLAISWCLIGVFALVSWRLSVVE